MSFNDSTSDMIATINNGQRARIAEIDVRSNKLNKAVLAVLKDQGFIIDFKSLKSVKVLIKLKFL